MAGKRSAASCAQFLGLGMGSMGWTYPRSIQIISVRSMHESKAVQTFFCIVDIENKERKDAWKTAWRKELVKLIVWVVGREARKGQVLSFGFSKGKSSKSRTSRPWRLYFLSFFIFFSQGKCSRHETCLLSLERKNTQNLEIKMQLCHIIQMSSS